MRVHHSGVTSVEAGDGKEDGAEAREELHRGGFMNGSLSDVYQRILGVTSMLKLMV
jgi:hypothetical protein